MVTADQHKRISEAVFRLAEELSTELSLKPKDVLAHTKHYVSMKEYDSFSIERSKDEILSLFDRGFSAKLIAKRLGFSEFAVSKLKPPKKRHTIISPDGLEHQFTISEFASHVGVKYTTANKFFLGEQRLCRGWRNPAFNPEPIISTKDKIEPLLQQGLSVRAIADRLGVASSTVSYHLKRISDKTKPVYRLRDADCVEYTFESVADFTQDRGLLNPAAHRAILNLVSGKALFYKGFYNPSRVPLENHENRERIYHLLDQKMSLPRIADKVGVSIEIVKYYSYAAKTAHRFNSSGEYFNPYAPRLKPEVRTRVSCAPIRPTFD